MVRDNVTLLMTSNGNVISPDCIDPYKYANHVVRFNPRRMAEERCLYHHLLIPEAISGYSGGSADHQKARRLWLGLGSQPSAPAGASGLRSTSAGASAAASSTDVAGTSGLRSTSAAMEGDVIAEADLSPAELKMFTNIRDAECRPFILESRRLIRYPCCYRVGLAGWATCLYCNAFFTYHENIAPSVPGILEATAASSRPSIKLRTAIAARAVIHKGFTGLKSTRGEFWSRIRKSLVWRDRWNNRLTLDEQIKFAREGYCPYMLGKGIVPPWVPTPENPLPPRDGLRVAADQGGLDYNFIRAVLACVDYIDANRASEPPVWDNDSEEGRAQIQAFQSSVFLAVFGAPNPNFEDIRVEPGGPAVAVQAPYLRPSQKQSVLDIYADAGVAMSAVLSGFDPAEEDAWGPPTASNSGAGSTRPE